MEIINLEDSNKSQDDKIKEQSDYIKDITNQLKQSETENMNLKDQLIDAKNLIADREYDIQTMKEEAAKQDQQIMNLKVKLQQRIDGENHIRMRYEQLDEEHKNLIAHSNKI